MTSSFGPVSTELEQQLREQVQRNKLIVWLDSANSYTSFVDRLIAERTDGDLNYDVKAYRGSYLEMLLDLQELTGGVDKRPLVIHLPGFNKTSVTTTPMLELYKAGTVFQKALPTLINESAATRLPDDQIESFLHEDDVSLEKADAWLSDVLGGEGYGLKGHLQSLSLTALIRDLLSTDEFVSKQLRESKGKSEQPQLVGEVTQRLASLTGASTEWLHQHLSKRIRDKKVSPADLATNAVSWALCVEYVVDLVGRTPTQGELKPIENLSDAVRNECCRLARHLRQHRPDFYRSTALDTQDRLESERNEATAEDLGQIDTFPFEEEKILRAAIEAVERQQWDKAIDWANNRTEDQSFWQRGDSSRSDAWKLVSQAAALGKAISVAGASLGEVDTLQAALDRYVKAGSTVDLAHRKLEEVRAKRLLPGIQEHKRIRAQLDRMRLQWRTWADQWASDFNQLCQKVGFLPNQDLQQRRVFDDVVRPTVNDSEVTALFLVDGMRFEMAQDLLSEMTGSRTTTMRLDARLAELPTITEVGMNVLAPVASGNRLQPKITNEKIKGFSTGNFRVYHPDTRRKAMKDRVGGSKCPGLTLKEVRERTQAGLKKSIAGAKLIVIDSKEIDNAGHNGSSPSEFADTLQQIKNAWRLLCEVGVSSFIITSDHGFLMFPEIDQPAQTHGRAIDPNGRHVITSTSYDHADEVCIPLRSLDYDCDEDLHMIAPMTAIPFDRGKRDRHFVHGGNSFQERVIPVLTIRHAVGRGKTLDKYQVTAVAGQAAFGMHRLKAILKLDQALLGLEYGSGESVELALQVADGNDIKADVKEVTGGARLETNKIMANVGEEFEVFFQLSGTEDRRVRVQLAHTSGLADVTPGVVSERFAVSVVQATTKQETKDEPKTETPEQPAASGWLADLPSDAIREVFAHLDEHGVITENEVATKLGSQRAARRFARQFDHLAKLAPFATRIDSVNGIKRYTKDGDAA